MSVLPRIDYASHPLYGGMLEADPGYRQRALDSLKPHLEEAEENERRRQQLFGYRHGHKEAIGEALVRDGFAPIQLPSASVDRIDETTRPITAMIRTRLEETRGRGEPIKYKTAHEALNPKDHAEVWDSLAGAVRDAGVLEISAAYFGAPAAKVCSAGLLVNQPDQDWANRLYRDVEVPTPPTAGFHIDSNGKCFVKLVLYLSDVGREQGPFGLIPGSHRWEEGGRGRIFRRAFDKSDMVVRSPKKRRMFISLPPEMQVKAEFGGDMIAGSAESEALLRNEVVAVGPRGQLNLFDPEAIHRGGNVRSGERRAVLITTEPKW